MANTSAYPLLGFSFKVNFLGISPEAEVQTDFQSVEGLKVSNTPIQVNEGGENRFAHQLPSRPTWGPLILKRGLFPDNTLHDWARDAIIGNVVIPANLAISLLDETHQPVMSWAVIHAIPQAMDLGTMDASKSEILVETLTLTYHYYNRL